MIRSGAPVPSDFRYQDSAVTGSPVFRDQAGVEVMEDGEALGVFHGRQRCLCSGGIALRHRDQASQDRLDKAGETVVG